MSDEDYERCRYSVSCQTDDLAVLHCLRALAQFAERSNIPKNIPWGGTGEASWRKANNLATFRFTSSDYRATMLAEASRLLPPGSWRPVAKSDSDPARRQR